MRAGRLHRRDSAWHELVVVDGDRVETACGIALARSAFMIAQSGAIDCARCARARQSAAPAVPPPPPPPPPAGPAARIGWAFAPRAARATRQAEIVVLGTRRGLQLKAA